MTVTRMTPRPGCRKISGPAGGMCRRVHGGGTSEPPCPRSGCKAWWSMRKSMVEATCDSSHTTTAMKTAPDGAVLLLSPLLSRWPVPRAPCWRALADILLYLVGHAAAVALGQTGRALVEGEAVDVAVLADAARFARQPGRTEPLHTRTAPGRISADDQGPTEICARSLKARTRSPSWMPRALASVRMDQ